MGIVSLVVRTSVRRVASVFDLCSSLPLFFFLISGFGLVHHFFCFLTSLFLTTTSAISYSCLLLSLLHPLYIIISSATPHASMSLRRTHTIFCQLRYKLAILYTRF